MSSTSQTNQKREQLDPSGPLINDWRIGAAAGLPPVLVEPVFANAADFLNRGTELDETTIEAAANLCCIGAYIYDHEAALTKAVKGLLGPFLEKGKVVSIESGFAANGVAPDWALGDSYKDPSNLFLIVEVMDIGGSGDSHSQDAGDTQSRDARDSHFQDANYFLHFWRQREDSDTFRNTCCPAFLLEVVGPHVRLSAVAWLDRVTMFPLTPLLNLLPAHPLTDRLLMPVARLLAALRTGVRELAEAHAAAALVAGAHAAPAALQQPTAAKKELPWPIGMEPRYDAATVKRLASPNFTYYVRLSGGGGDAEAVVIKLCRKYGLAAHRAWADLGLAPQILREKPLPDGWQLVQMEWLPEPAWRRLSDLPGRELHEALGAVKEALKKAHRETGMVHGDVRPSNCLVRRGAKGARSWQVRFVDFEWAGPEGEATYPACMNPDVPWPEGVDYGMPLQRAHDLQLLAASSAGHAAGDGSRGRGPSAARSLHTAARDRCAVPQHKAPGVMLRPGVGLGWRQRAAAGWLRPVAASRRLAW